MVFNNLWKYRSSVIPELLRRQNSLVNHGAKVCLWQEAFLIPSPPEIWIDWIYGWKSCHSSFLDPVQLEAATGFFHHTFSLCSLLLHLSRSLLHLNAQPLCITHHLNVVMLSWQLKCFLSACWVNWLSQKCFLSFTLPPANVHTHWHGFRCTCEELN